MVLVIAREYGKILVIASPEHAVLDWQTAMAEISYRFGFVPNLKSEWDALQCVRAWERGYDQR